MHKAYGGSITDAYSQWGNVSAQGTYVDFSYPIRLNRPTTHVLLIDYDYTDKGTIQGGQPSFFVCSMGDNTVEKTRFIAQNNTNIGSASVIIFGVAA